VQRPVRTDVGALLQGARAIGLLAEGAEVQPGRLEDYWRVCADLITLSLDIEQTEMKNPSADADEPEMIDLRRRLRAISAELAEMTLE